MIAWIFAIVVLAIVGKLIYDVQQKKNKPTQTENRFDTDGFDKEAFQKLAGIKPINENDELRQILVKNNFPKEQIVEALLKAAENSEFPAPDESINVRTEKITTIDTNFPSDKDPLESVPMSRISKEAKQKMAEIAKQDISNQLEQNAEKFEAISGKKACGCGRSETGYCIGLHKIPKKDWEAGVVDLEQFLSSVKTKAVPSENDQRLGIELVKPKRKYTKKPKA